jgi:pimeloyl-ACP methyl ester carboxylesterase
VTGVKAEVQGSAPGGDRGAGHSSRPRSDPGQPADLRGEAELARGGYTKWEMAGDIHLLLHDHLGLTEPAFVLGLDIGSMVATAYAFRYRDDIRALGYGEASQPGTSFYDRLGARPSAVDTDTFVRAYEQPGAMRAGFDLYRAFGRDAEDIRAALGSGGKLKIPCLGLYGDATGLPTRTPVGWWRRYFVSTARRPGRDVRLRAAASPVVSTDRSIGSRGIRSARIPGSIRRVCRNVSAAPGRADR